MSYSKLSLLSLPNTEQPLIPSSINSQSQSNQSLSQDVENPALSEMIRTAKQRPVLTIKRGPRGYGFTLRAIKVYYDDSDYFTIQHLVIHLEHQGPAYSAGLKCNDIITHVNDEVVCGKMHHEIVQSIMLSVNNTLRLHTIQLAETSIKTGGRKRSPSKSKFSRPGLMNLHMQHQHQAHNYQNMQFAGGQAAKLNPAHLKNIRGGGVKPLNSSSIYFASPSQHAGGPNQMQQQALHQQHMILQQQQQQQLLNQPTNMYSLQNASYHGSQSYYGNYPAANSYFNQGHNASFPHQFKVNEPI